MKCNAHQLSYVWMTVANHTCSLIHSFTITFVTPFFCTPCPHRVPEPLGVRRDFLTCQALTSNILFVEVCFGDIGIFQNYGKLASQFAQQTPRSMAKQNFWQARTLPGFQTSLLKCNRRNPKGPRSCKILPRWRSLFITRTSLRIWLLPMVTSFRSWCSFNFKGPRKVKGDQWSASNEQDEQALRILARKLISPFSKTFEASLTRPLLQKADFAEIRLTLSHC